METQCSAHAETQQPIENKTLASLMHHNHGVMMHICQLDTERTKSPLEDGLQERKRGIEPGFRAPSSLGVLRGAWLEPALPSYLT